MELALKEAIMELAFRQGCQGRLRLSRKASQVDEWGCLTVRVQQLCSEVHKLVGEYHAGLQLLNDRRCACTSHS
jgi:hypothetical protein